MGENKVRKCRKLNRNGGPEGIRTPDLLNANQALSQLSYRPLQHTNPSLDLTFPITSGRSQLSYRPIKTIYYTDSRPCLTSTLFVALAGAPAGAKHLSRVPIAVVTRDFLPTFSLPSVYGPSSVRNVPAPA